ncbi:MAG: type II secretion system protein GspC [Woeseia sp.]|nr:type II secretion system protein GspC [Woeseia sp.]|tara:strand:+ start:8595 stop:9506 length:912 start_codon:yes stop_codon:yes gene_type:complete
MISRVNSLNLFNANIININRFFPSIISLLLVLLIAWQLSSLIWLFLFDNKPRVNLQSDAPVAYPLTTSKLFDANQIAVSHLFGISGEKAINSSDYTAPDDDLADTKLVNLILNGTVASDKPSYSIAIISNNGKDQKVYSVGDAVNNNASLYAVYSDRVVLNENGILTNLKLPRQFKDELFSTTIKNVNISRTSINNENSIQSVAAKNLSQLTDVIRPAPYRVNGKQIGFRVYPGRERAQFMSLGLKPGDIIKEIDGKTLSDINQTIQVFESLDARESVEIKIERNGQTQSLTLKTDQLDLNDE